jgi:hypothetical protein
VVEDKVLSFSWNREIIDKTIQDTIRRILTNCKMYEIAKFCIILSFLTCKTLRKNFYFIEHNR